MVNQLHKHVNKIKKFGNIILVINNVLLKDNQNQNNNSKNSNFVEYDDISDNDLWIKFIFINKFEW